MPSKSINICWLYLRLVSHILSFEICGLLKKNILLLLSERIMDIKGLLFSIIILCTFLSVGVNCQNQDYYERMPVMPPARRPLPPELTYNNHHNNSWNSGFMQTAKSFVASPLGQFTMSMAKEMVARSAGGNEVLSLNITSLLILVMLKALIFTTGLLGAGNWQQYGRARMLEDGSKWKYFETIIVVPWNDFGMKIG